MRRAIRVLLCAALLCGGLYLTGWWAVQNTSERLVPLLPSAVRAATGVALTELRYGSVSPTLFGVRWRDVRASLTPLPGNDEARGPALTERQWRFHADAISFSIAGFSLTHYQLSVRGLALHAENPHVDVPNGLRGDLSLPITVHLGQTNGDGPDRGGVIWWSELLALVEKGESSLPFKLKGILSLPSGADESVAARPAGEGSRLFAASAEPQ